MKYRFIASIIVIATIFVAWMLSGESVETKNVSSETQKQQQSNHVPPARPAGGYGSTKFN